MMGLRGCRLGIVHPEITEMQVRGGEGVMGARGAAAWVLYSQRSPRCRSGGGRGSRGREGLPPGYCTPRDHRDAGLCSGLGRMVPTVHPAAGSGTGLLLPGCLTVSSRESCQVLAPAPPRSRCRWAGQDRGGCPGGRGGGGHAPFKGRGELPHVLSSRNIFPSSLPF